MRSPFFFLSYLILSKSQQKVTPPRGVTSKSVVIGHMLHDVLDAALQDIAQPVDGVDLHILVVPQAVDLARFTL